MEDNRRSLTLLDTVMIVSGSMIGSGIFIVAADMTRVLGSPFWVLVCWLISGIITLFAALSYGELAGMMPQAGGQFIYLKRAFGSFTSFLYGWSVFMVIQTGVIAAVAVAFAKYLLVLLPIQNENQAVMSLGKFAISTPQLIAVASVVFLTWLNSMGIRNGKVIQRVFTITKITALAAVIITGFVAASPEIWKANMSVPFSGSPVNADPTDISATALMAALGVALIGSLFSSDAWNNVTFIAGEVKRPERNIFLGLLIGVIIVSLLYVLANIAYFMLLPAGSPGGLTVMEKGVAYAENDRVGTAALSPIFGNTSVILMAVLIVISTFGCNNGLILAGARLFYSMAREGLFFRAAGHLNKAAVPGKALWFQCIWASVLCLSGSYGDLLDYCTFASLLFYILTIAGLFVLRRKEPDTPRPYKAFGYPVIPALYILIAGAICIDLLIFKQQNTLWGLIIISFGIPVYYLFKRTQNAPLSQ
jgi:basic amino acid/polyamine antiporter, APA family